MSQQHVEQRVVSHRDFLRYVERRVGDRALAEEIVQDGGRVVQVSASSSARTHDRR